VSKVELLTLRKGPHPDAKHNEAALNKAAALLNALIDVKRISGPRARRAGRARGPAARACDEARAIDGGACGACGRLSLNALRSALREQSADEAPDQRADQARRRAHYHAKNHGADESPDQRTSRHYSG